MRPVQDHSVEARPSLARVARSSATKPAPKAASKPRNRANLPEPRIGTSGWHYDSWWGPVFPEGLRKKDARLLRDPLQRDRAQRALLPHADLGGRARLVQSDAGR